MPTIPPHLRAILSLAAMLLVPAASVIQPPWGGLVALLAIACALAAGVTVKVPTWIQGRPILRGSSVVALTPLVGVLLNNYQHAPDALEGGGSLLGAVLLSWLAGIPLPQPGPRPASEVVANHATATAEALGRTLKRE